MSERLTMEKFDQRRLAVGALIGGRVRYLDGGLWWFEGDKPTPVALCGDGLTRKEAYLYLEAFEAGLKWTKSAS